MQQQQTKFNWVTILVIVFFIVLAFLISVLASSVKVKAGDESTGSLQQDDPSKERSLTPAGTLIIDRNTRQAAVGSLAVDFVRSPDTAAGDGRGRYLIAVDSGFGIQFNSGTNGAQQSVMVIDLNARVPEVIQNVYFPSPQSVNVGVVFDPTPDANGSYALYVSGGFENKIWHFRFKPGARFPISPGSSGPDTKITAPFIEVSGFATEAPSESYNGNKAPVYPAGLAISPDGNTLYVANNLSDNLGIINDLRGRKRIERVDLHRDNEAELIYPYGVAALRSSDGQHTAKVYVSCWNTGSVAVIGPRQQGKRVVKHIGVGQHPTAMIFNRNQTRLFVVNSNSDTVSVIDTTKDEQIEQINVRLNDDATLGNTPESMALSADEKTLYVANAHSNSIAVVALSTKANSKKDDDEKEVAPGNSKVRGFIPTGKYPSAVAVANNTVFICNGKGTGVENSSLLVNDSGRAPNIANDRFPIDARRPFGGQYILSLISSTVSYLNQPDDAALVRYTQQVMQNNGLVGQQRTRLFSGPSPIKHVIYIIKENRTYDQVFGDVAKAGNGQAADGDPSLAIFGSGETAQLADGPSQDISPNHRALALRFGLFDRFFVNSEASPDGHNWSTAAFSSDYVDKGYRWQYSGRGRTYDYEGFNRLPDYEPASELAPLFHGKVTPDNVTDFLRQYVPYLNGSRDVAEPESLYLWDAAAKAGLSYRNCGEFVSVFSQADVKAMNEGRPKRYPDTTPTVRALPTKKSLEGHHSPTFRAFDTTTPDIMTVDSYKAAKNSDGRVDAAITLNNPEESLRGDSRFSEWLAEFNGYVKDRQSGRDTMPSLTVMRFPNDHTNGLSAGKPTPQFYVAENDYAIGRLVEAVSNSPYWNDTAIFMVEDDAQDGPDHVDAHRSVCLVVSAYNRPGQLVHHFHNTVSLIRTIELVLGIAPMNQLDATAIPMDIFQDKADLRPFTATLPNVAMDNLMVQPARDERTAYWIKHTNQQNLTRADLADPLVLNQIIWYSVRRNQPMPKAVMLPAFGAMKLGIPETGDDDEHQVKQTAPD
jgi:YVTN family beta-propeller protein